MVVCFFFKRKTAYELRISDWSSDVCSSDLQRAAGGAIERDVMLGRAGGDDVAVVAQVLRRWPDRRGEADEAVGTEPVVDVFVGLVAHRAVGERHRRDRKSVG